MRCRGQTHKTRRRFEGIVNLLLDKQRESESEEIIWELREIAEMRTCTACSGHRLKPESLAVRIGGYSIADLCDMPVEELLRFLEGYEFSDSDIRIAGDGLNEIRERLRFLAEVGLGYLNLNRAAPTLSGERLNA